jgi:hypothetical protein
MLMRSNSVSFAILASVAFARTYVSRCILSSPNRGVNRILSAGLASSALVLALGVATPGARAATVAQSTRINGLFEDRGWASVTYHFGGTSIGGEPYVSAVLSGSRLGFYRLSTPSSGYASARVDFDVEGARFSATLHDIGGGMGEVEVRIRSAFRDERHNTMVDLALSNNADVWLYEIEFLLREGSRWTWVNPCGSSNAAIALYGTWDSGGEYQDSRRITFHCAEGTHMGTAAKCVRELGYHPWRTVSAAGRPVSMKPYFLSCTSGLAALYCEGSSQSGTVDGTPVVAWDDMGWNVPASLSGYALDSIWWTDSSLEVANGDATYVASARRQEIEGMACDLAASLATVDPDAWHLYPGHFFIASSVLCHSSTHEGPPQALDCSDCTRAICSRDPYCCGDRGGSWDAVCVDQAQAIGCTGLSEDRIGEVVLPGFIY